MELADVPLQSKGYWTWPFLSIALVAIVLVEICWGQAPECYYDPSSTVVKYLVALDETGRMNPYQCFLWCQKSDTVMTGRPITLAISEAKYCFCGYEFTPAEKASMEVSTNCNMTCTDGSPCGGAFGILSVYSSYSVKATAPLTLTVHDLQQQALAATTKDVRSSSIKVTTGEKVFIRVNPGEYACHSFRPCETPPAAGAAKVCVEQASAPAPPIDCASNPGAVPPLEVVVDYGDGSGPVTWSRENTVDVWSHEYSRPGLYAISVVATNVYSAKRSWASTKVAVIERVMEEDQMEIVCPPVVFPGTYFTCVADVPTGNGLAGSLVFQDDLSLTNLSYPIEIPEKWSSVTGGPIQFASYNTSSSFTSQAKEGLGFVVQASAFGRPANITALEFVPMSTGTLIVEIVKPVCSSGKVWCTMTMGCETTCLSTFEAFVYSKSNYTCSSKHLCSAEESCFATMTCPSSTVSGSPEVPVSFTVVKTLWTGNVSLSELSKRKVIKFPKSVIVGNISDLTQPYVGFKTNVEETYPADSFLAFRCSSVSACVTLPFRETLVAKMTDLVTSFNGSTYTVVNDSQGTLRRHAIRVHIQEDRVFQIKKRLFCDQTTEKTVFLQVVDLAGFSKTVKTRRVSCQYPIIGITDLSPQHELNTLNNTWSVLTPFPTDQALKDNPKIKKAYLASLWVRQDETIYFVAKFSRGSHVSVTWQLTVPADAGDTCATALKPGSVASGPSLDPKAPFADSEGSPCLFPFRYNHVLYYGCTNIPIRGDPGQTYQICATQVDEDYNAVQVSWCNVFCHVQEVRPEDTGTTASQTSVLQEGDTSSNQTYLLPVETTLVLKRTFKIVGLVHMLTLTAYNMLNLKDVAVLTWQVICAAPVIPADWSISFVPFQRAPHGSPYFSFTINVAGEGIKLPTMPTLRIVGVSGGQRTDQPLEVLNSSAITFYPNHQGAPSIPDCVQVTLNCFNSYTFKDMGVHGGSSMISGTNGSVLGSGYGDNITVTIPAFKAAGSHGFSVQFFNGISSIKYNHTNMIPATQEIQILDPAPLGTGEVVTISVTQWDFFWVEMFDKIEGPIQFQLQYTLPNLYPNEIFNCDYANRKWYLRAGGVPSFRLDIYKGSARRIQYTLNSTDPSIVSPPPCFKDWPEGTFIGVAAWTIDHCTNLTEGLYTLAMSAWNPIDGWVNSKPTLVSVLAMAGPITIDDFLIVTDANEVKKFRIVLKDAGTRTCIAVNWGDESPFEYWGNLVSCQIRYPNLVAADVKEFDPNIKAFDCRHIFLKRGLYRMHAFAYDERNYAESFQDVTIFKLQCTAPKVWLPVNVTTFDKWNIIPTIQRSKTFQVAAMAVMECNGPALSYMKWFAYSVEVVDAGHAGKKEILTKVPISEIVPSWNTSLLDVPPLVFKYGLHKLVFRFEIDTGDPAVPLYKEAFTYVNITKSPLMPILLEGSPSKVSRGWGQALTLYPSKFSKDPDFPNEKTFNYAWFCRKILPLPAENYSLYDQDGYPVYKDDLAQDIRKVGEAVIFNPPPGCFGKGPGPIRGNTGILGLNTASLITYSQIYEIGLVLSKDTRKSMVVVELEMGSLPAPVVEIRCISQDLCFPKFGGVFVNPTSRLALKGNCLEQCRGTETYLWSVYTEKSAPLNVTYCGAPIEATTTERVLTSTAKTTTAAAAAGATPRVIKKLRVTVMSHGASSSSNLEKTAAAKDLSSSFGPVFVTKSLIKGAAAQGSISRKKRNVPLGGRPEPGCRYVFGDGSRDARDSKELAIQQKFFDLQSPSTNVFMLKLNVTQGTFDGRGTTYASGVAYMKVFINEAPVNGTCSIQVKKTLEASTGKTVWAAAQTGRALMDEFLISCQNWVDPNGNSITKYIFKMAQNKERAVETSILYTGPLPESKVILPLGQFQLYAEVRDEAGAFNTFVISELFPTVLPDEADYKNLDLSAMLKSYSDIGDQARVSQIIQADASIRASACWFNLTCSLGLQTGGKGIDINNMDEKQLGRYQDITRQITHANTGAIKSAKSNLQFKSVDQLEQGASTLYSITSNLVGNIELSKTLDMSGRQAAVEMMEAMASGFKNIQVSDPSKLTGFIQGVTGSTMAVLYGLNSILYSNDPSQIPLTDFEAAADMPYDTDIPEGDADIPLDPGTALRMNAMKLTRIKAVAQVKKMTNLIDKIGETVIVNSVVGEELRTKSPLGVQMIMTKIPASTTVGADSDGDGLPDVKLRYKFDNSMTVVEFPLGFCPGSPDKSFVDKSGCVGQWGLVIKEWDTITATYPDSVQNLNKVTKQVDVTVYGDLGGEIDIQNMTEPITFVIERIESKDPAQVQIPDKAKVKVNAEARLKVLKSRNKMALIFHAMNVTKPNVAINIQVALDERATSNRLAVLARFQHLPSVSECDLVKVLAVKPTYDDGFVDWFINDTQVGSRVGSWFFAVVGLKAEALGTVKDRKPCNESGLSKDHLDWDFGTKSYTFAGYTSGSYYLSQAGEWEAKGLRMLNTSKLATAFTSTHLSSFATGFMAMPNSIDFHFVFAAASFSDNITIFVLIISSFLVYSCVMIWAIIKDRKDLDALVVPFMVDNHPDDKYLYEMVVETGPIENHATTSKINFIMSGDKEVTDVRLLNDPKRRLFKKGAKDSFLMAVPRPLGDLQHLRIWTDSSGLGEMSAWYLLSVAVHDVQTGVVTRFVADQWLAIDRGSFEDDITIQATEEGHRMEPSFLVKSYGGHSLSDDHLWWSVFSRPVRSRFTRAQRATVCMALLYLSVMTSAMYYNRVDRVTSAMFVLAFLEFDTNDFLVGMVSNLIVFPPVILCILLFKRSKPFKRRQNRIDRGVLKAQDEGKTNIRHEVGKERSTDLDQRRVVGWPAFGVVIGWVISLASIGGGAFLVFAYGISFGNDKMYQWVTSIIVSFFTSILITQPLQLVTIVLMGTVCCKISKVDDDPLHVDENPPKVYFDPHDPALAKRPKFKPEKPIMEPEFYEHLKWRKITEQEMKAVIRDLTTYVTYVAIIVVISYGNRDPYAYMEKSALESALIFGGTNCDVLQPDDPRFKACTDADVPIRHVNFNMVKDVNQWWGWMEMTLIPNVRVQPWYNGQSPYGLRGYLDDRVNRIIGYAIVRQTREAMGSCMARQQPARQVRDFVPDCTGENGAAYEDQKDWCFGWRPKTDPNCTVSDEFNYQSEDALNSLPLSAGVRRYGGGGYVLKLKGYIDDLNSKIGSLTTGKWVDNRTRSLSVEFSVYNAQINMFGLVTIVAEFMGGGGVVPWYRIEAFRLFNDTSFFGYLVMVAEVLFVVATFYYMVGLVVGIKQQGIVPFFGVFWNLVDFFTVGLSIVAILLWVLRRFIVDAMSQKIEASGGNAYIRMTTAALISQAYTYVMAFTVFTSTIKMCRLLSFQKAFKQIGATIKLCFVGLSTFVLEFSIVFVAFSAYFYFALKNQLSGFKDFLGTIQSTMAMSIGKFNFSAIRQADHIAAWIFFGFSIAVNVVLINMMMAIINFAFEDIKNNVQQYKNKFELLEYMKRSAKEMLGLTVAEPIRPIYVDKQTLRRLRRAQEELEEDDAGPDKDPTEEASDNFARKTDALLQYVSRTYLSDDFADSSEAKQILDKISEIVLTSGNQANVKDVGFDEIFRVEGDQRGSEDPYSDANEQ